MNNVISTIFKHYNYSKVENCDVELFSSLYTDDYWILYTGTPNSLDRDKQIELLEKCQKICNDPALEKNANILCLWCVDDIDKDTISQLHQLEEDIYFFKKNVLYYTQSEFDSFVEEYSKSSIIDLISKAPTNPKIFSLYKSNNTENLWTLLLYRICMKITFIPISTGESEEISNLLTNHDVELKKNKDLKILDEIALKLDISDTSLYPEVLLTMITESLQEERK